MKTQLVDRYLRDNQCQHGLYVIGWFNQESWDESDPRRNQVPKWSVHEERKFFELQASKLSRDGPLVRSYVLDVTLR